MGAVVPVLFEHSLRRAQDDAVVTVGQVLGISTTKFSLIVAGEFVLFYPGGHCGTPLQGKTFNLGGNSKKPKDKDEVVLLATWPVGSSSRREINREPGFSEIDAFSWSITVFDHPAYGAVATS
ncbi:hypothetical protein E2562_029381 [Oryza meyeriana var. granulata]|uniref:Uncharacterized protein n=1 Tax=Oryza meyeriana var. granulata TaxID=110450 RepID=A0A6G1C123_9ORYZ|nr:hypothetical protein E2562_029381 [Oryza meyeriana var. granulata]